MWLILIAVVLVPPAILAALIAFGISAPPPPLASISEPFRHIDFSDLPPPETFAARDGTALTYRVYRTTPPADRPERVVIAIHGSSATGTSLHALAKALRAADLTVYVPDIRGHGGSGRRGDIDYPRQLDADLADLLAVVHAAHPGAQLVLLGFSSGGGFALHAAATPNGSAFERTILLSPMLGPRAPTVRSRNEAWAKPFIPRIIALILLNRLGVHALDYLPVLAFGIERGNPAGLTGIYSFRLMQAFGTLDYAADLRRARGPIAILVGEKDELMNADLFGPTVHAERADVPITIVPGLGHIQMSTDPRADPTIIAAIKAGGQ